MSNNPLSKKILIVEDEIDMRIFLNRLVKSLGFLPDTAKNGIEGLNKAIEIQPNLILLDVMMPEVGGAKLYVDIRSNPQISAIPVLMISGVAQPTFNHYLKMHNIHLSSPILKPNGYLEKPVDPQQLCQMIQTIVNEQ